DADGKPVVIINSSDVTEQAALHRQVVDAERLASLGRVASSMAHEFNNVLMGIQPFADLISRTRDAARLEKASTGIQSAVRRGRTITQQVLRFTRGEKPDRRNTQVEQVLGMLRKELVPALPADVRLEISSTPSDLRVLADGDQIEQMLMNLAMNARDAMSRGGGTLTIDVRPAEGRHYPFGVLPGDAGGFVHISVTDTGAGIPAELFSRIFEPLFTTKKAQGGSGLGLTISQQIVTAHGGAIFVESEIGTGSSFHVFLPAASAIPLSSEVQPPAYPTGLDRVLIVEDDDLVADAMMTALGSVHILAHRVATGSAATDAVESFKPGLVVLDYGLPDMSGAAVYQLLRARWKDLPIVFATGHADAAQLREEVGDPALQVCLKPFEITRLLGAMTSALGARA
ncbi:MAG: ATP-binding protein, partial [Acidobacteriota bacterium]